MLAFIGPCIAKNYTAMRLESFTNHDPSGAPTLTLDIDELYRTHRRRALSVACAYLKDEEEARDAVQEAFIKAQRAADTFNGRSSPQSWLCRIVANVCLDIRRWKRRRPEQHVEDVDVVDANARLSECPEHNMADQELLEAISAGLDRLSDNHREIILLREVTGLNYDEIAEHEGCPKGTVMSRLFHARRQLRAALGRKLDPSLLPAC